jgi:hypothetical protein
LRDASTEDEENSSNSIATGVYSGLDQGTSPNKTSAIYQQQDSELVQKLVDAVFEKSHAIDAMLDNNHVSSSNVKTPPLYTNRTKLQQMEYIEELVKENNLVINELYSVVQETIQQRDLCRQYIIKNSEMILSPLPHDDSDDNSDKNKIDVTANTGTTSETENGTSTILHTRST